MDGQDVLGKIKFIKDLPTLPFIIKNIQELLKNPKTSASDIGTLISKDQVLTAKLLRIANSALYCFPKEITTITQAITIMGFRAIKNLILSTSVFNLFKPRSSSAFDLQRFWEHSIACAVGGKVIAETVGYEDVEELFVAGLLHDIGKIVQDEFLEEEFQQVLKLSESEKLLIYVAEKQLWNVTHSQTGAILGERWGLPVKLIDSITYHHDPVKSEHFSLHASIIHLSDILARSLGLGSGGDPWVPTVNNSAWKLLSLQESSLEPITEKIRIEYGVAISLLQSEFENGSS